MIVRFSCPKCGAKTKTENGMRSHYFFIHGGSLKGQQLRDENREINPAKQGRNHLVRRP